MFQLTSSSSSSSYLTIIILIIIFLGSSLFRFSTSANTHINCYDYAKAGESIYCGSGLRMRYPFWPMKMQEQQQQHHCGYPGLGITCSPNRKPVISIFNQSYYVISDFVERNIRELTIVDPDFVEKLCSRPRRNFTIDQNSSSRSAIRRSRYNDELSFYLNCTSPPPPQIHIDIRYGNRSHHIECLDYNHTIRSYGFYDFEIRRDSDLDLLADWSGKYCTESVVVLVADADQVSEYMQTLQIGFYVELTTPFECKRCESSGGICSYNVTNKNFRCWCRDEGQLRHGAGGREYCFNYGALRNKILIGVFTGLGGLMFTTLLFVCHKNERKRRRSIAKNVELFLESYGCHSSQRYKYKDIKKMTNSFKDKLGEGGYGSVFKGKLVDGRLVAVKVLINNPKKNTNGEDFMNEVATIGRTNHINIVALIGFCSSGSNRALVYEFMPNGSLEKFIYAKKEKSMTTECTSDTATITSAASNEAVLSLGWEKLYQIALGIARGLEYLHRGCNTGRILHLDIKPHNILLDENFCPKISDFGLAKLCTTRESIVSMLSGGRGTLGYIAPEVYNRNFGGVSYKSDVYSYGMMVLEMVGGRKNIDPFVENTSEIYFPHWIYNHLEKDMGTIESLLKFEEAFDEEMAKKMIMVGLWCIQTHQESRPSMGRVAEMLEGNIEDLQMPPNPSLHQPPTS